MDHSLGVLATLILATRRPGAEDEGSIEELSVVKYAIASLDPAGTRINNTKTDMDNTRQQITKLEEKIHEATTKREELLTKIDGLRGLARVRGSRRRATPLAIFALGAASLALSPACGAGSPTVFLRLNGRGSSRRGSSPSETSGSSQMGSSDHSP